MGPQDGPKRPEDDTKKAQVEPMITPKCPNMATRGHQEGPKMSPRRPKLTPRCPKMAQEGTKRPQDDNGRARKRAQFARTPSAHVYPHKYEGNLVQFVSFCAPPALVSTRARRAPDAHLERPRAQKTRISARTEPH